MLHPLDKYYQQHEEPVKSALDYLRRHILKADPGMTEAWKYGMPFFCYKGKMICYLWTHKVSRQPYLGVVDGKRISHPGLVAEKRAKMKVLLIDPSSDIPVNEIDEILQAIFALHRSTGN